MAAIGRCSPWLGLAIAVTSLCHSCTPPPLVFEEHDASAAGTRADSGGQDGSSGAGGAGGSDGGPSRCDVVRYTFDGCDEGWTAGGRNSNWECGAPTTGPGSDHNGQGNAWATGLDVVEPDCSDAWLESPEIDLSLAPAPLYLVFWHWYDFRVCDPGRLLCGIVCADPSVYSGGAVEVKDSAEVWSTASPDMGKMLECEAMNDDGGALCQPCALQGKSVYRGSSAGWTQRAIDISAYRHPRFRARFRFGSNVPDDCHPPGAGWYIDDVRVTPGSCP